jgi:hypothetical protein
MVCSDQAIRPHCLLVCCAFALCWRQEAQQAQQARQHVPVDSPVQKKPAGALANAVPLASDAALGADA